MAAAWFQALANDEPTVRPQVIDHRGKRDEIEFRGSALGAAKSKAEAIHRQQRAVFADIQRILEAWAEDGITIDPGQIEFPDDVGQAAWRRYCLPVTLRSPLEPPLMDMEDELLRAVQ